MKVRELICDPLDIWVCRAELEEFSGQRLDASVMAALKAKLGTGLPYWPSRDWLTGGAIIARERIAVIPEGDEWVALWHPESWPSGVVSTDGPAMTGPTALIAAMRCYVASKYGDEVPA
ncbi:phage protein NinX family protein [Paraburkholderia nodosa]|uniref:phage protein NinX family protein n=1 Tax=Paraburkholderia nodosa TaxID=392320 RepID=UPI0004B77BE8|nr:phage protein NinX family protein [Paraburkholderia nodosa]